MTAFLLACAGLVLLSGVFFLFRPLRQGATEDALERANLEIFQRRQQELEQERREEGDEGLEEDARLRLLEEARGEESSSVDSSSFPVWALLPLVALAASGLYYHLGAAEDVLIAEQLAQMPADASPEHMRELVSTVEQRSRARPDNLHYLALLGRYYMGGGEYDNAAKTYSALVEAAPEDAQLLAYAAQAEYLAADRTLTDRSRLRAEQALAVNPHQRTALGMLGMASFELGEYAAAISYWERLLAVEPPGSEGAEMIAGVIATARQHLGEPAGGVEPVAGKVESPADAGDSVGVTVRVTAPAGSDIKASDSVFILARNAASGSRMPIAVQRLTGAQLPVTLRLDDSNSMAGQKLSQTASVVVAVQVSPGGQPGEANASWLGQIGPVTPSLDEAPLDIELAKNAP